MSNSAIFQRLRDHRAMLSAMQAGTATPEQQQAAFAHIKAMHGQQAADAIETQREARDAYNLGRSDEQQNNHF